MTHLGRCRYSPNTTLSRESTRPFDAGEAVAEGSFAPAGSNTIMGLPMGGANFDPLIKGCLPQQTPRSGAGARAGGGSSLPPPSGGKPGAKPPLPDKGGKEGIVVDPNYGGKKSGPMGNSWEF